MVNLKSGILLGIKIIVYSILTIIIFTLIYLAVDIFRASHITSDIAKKVLVKEANILEVNDLSTSQLNILLKVEDPNFYHHEGVDIKAPGAGWTTITQSLVKMYYFEGGFKPGFLRFNKIRQTLIARFVFNKKISKNDQLKLLSMSHTLVH